MTDGVCRHHSIVTKIRLKEMMHCMPHDDPSILTLSICKGERAVVHLSLLFMARLHFLLLGGSVHVSMSYTYDGIPIT